VSFILVSEDPAVDEDSDVYFVSWASPPRAPVNSECIVMAVCRTSSRMDAVQLFRGKSLSAFASRDVKKLSHKDVARLDCPEVSPGEVLVRDAFGKGPWEPAR